MSAADRLYLYEEITLLALHDERGTVTASFAESVIAGAILADLLLEKRIEVDDSKRQDVRFKDTRALGDPLLDESLQRMVAAKKLAPLAHWLTRLAVRTLPGEAARQLCNRGILHAADETVLLVFKREVYPEVDPVPEQEILERLHSAVFGDERPLDGRTIALVSLAHAAGLLAATFGQRNVDARKDRVEQIVSGELAGAATREVIQACQAAVVLAILAPEFLPMTNK